MPKGQSRNGFRLTKKRKAMLDSGMSVEAVLQAVPPKNPIVHAINAPQIVLAQPFVPVYEETDEDIEQYLEERFSSMRDFVDMVATKDCRALVLSGPAGIGKTFSIQGSLDQLEQDDQVTFTRIAGYARPTALFKTLYANRFENCVIVMDDIDSVLLDETSLNILKGATDSSDKRIITWGSEYEFTDEDGEKIPKTFEFKGNVIIITNLSLDEMIAKGTKIAEHLAAIRSRAIYVSLQMKNYRYYLVHIRNVVYKHGMLDNLSFEERVEVMSYVEDNLQKFRDMSLRTVLKIAAMRKAQPDRWLTLAKVTCFRNS